MDVLSLIGGLAMFLFGMSVMSNGLEKRAGNKLKAILANMTSNPIKAFLLGLVVTVIVQSSSATTVMVVGFVNSGIMTLSQCINIIVGANLGSTSTSWLLSLTGIQGEGILSIFKPSTFTPILAFIGIIMYTFLKSQKKKDIGSILLGFAVLMFGMELMSGSVDGLRDNENFTNILTAFTNPILGVVVGIVFTAIIQSSGASIGILQALSTTGQITYIAAIPIIMGQNIGTCISAVISSIGATKNAKRAAAIHVLLNVLGMLILLPCWYVANLIFKFTFINDAASPFGIAVVNTVYKLIAMLILLPFNNKIVKLSERIIKDTNNKEVELLDERFFSSPSVAIARCRDVANNMARLSIDSLHLSFKFLDEFNQKDAELIRENEDKVDIYEDKLGSYLVKLSSHDMTEKDSNEATKILHMIGDLERLSDHSVNIIESFEEMNDKKLSFSDQAKKELRVLISAVSEILDLSFDSFVNNNLQSAAMVEPLEQVIDHLKDELKKQHVVRLRQGDCTIEMGFILTDLLTNLERISDHCSNIAGCMLEMAHDNMDIHEYLRKVRGGGYNEFNKNFDMFSEKYSLAVAT